MKADITYPVVERKDAFNLFLSQFRGALEGLTAEEVLLHWKQSEKKKKWRNDQQKVEMISKNMQAKYAINVLCCKSVD